VGELMNTQDKTTKAGERTQMEREVTELLWDYLPKDPEHKDRRKTGWGTKTKIGLVACIERIAAGE
jgi:hypothetical protein